MNRFPNFRPPAFDAAQITDTIERALAGAGLDTRSGPMASVTRTIHEALSAHGLSAQPHVPAAADEPLDVAARIVDTPDTPDTSHTLHALHERPQHGPGVIDSEAPGRFESHRLTNAVGSLAYKLYVPARLAEEPALVVMLHGCTQSADDFAAGTRMNRLAEEHGFLAVYPEQSSHANVSKCWNWFKAEDQVRDAGEPALIAGIVREVAARHGVDPRRVFVAGLSAGAAMSVVLGQAYPEMFAGVGVHSGLPYASAHDIPSAMAAMKAGRGRAGASVGARAGRAPSARAQAGSAGHAVPTIVFHGDRDHTVQHDNGTRIVNEAVAAFSKQGKGEPLQSSTRQGTSPAGQSYSCTVHADATGAAKVESWTLHGAGHAWSGGDAAGSYTDARGPDASAEMIRFFMAIPRAGSA